MGELFTLQPLVVGVFPEFPLNRFIESHDTAATVAAPCLAWLARSEDRTVLVDTGPPVPTPHSAAIHVGLEVKPEHRIDQALIAADVDPGDVDTVVLTHLHFDHCANGEYLPNARFLVQAAELQFAVLPDSPIQRIGYEVGYPGIIPAWMSVFDRMEVVHGRHEVAPGCTMLPLPGHSPGSAGAVFQTARGRLAVVGDLVNQIENWHAPGGGHATPALYSSHDDCQASFALLEREADHVLASHDFRMLDEEWG